ncbi:protein ANTAGONIST OF LIKE HETEROCHROMATIN PROTEIN 1-like [Haliotis rufescens]|uniref:protein ANTAGONIST OF LIKE HETEROCHROMATIN PROTEIN 1-like n=1 Tax=Haliotis rufescens TaxID=6454 RepID=UPI001EB087F0|nr:protein ANTAGONIST OF LIKE HETEROCHROMATIN PROTEIN 1-like [Haliotis rufescens]
MADILLKSVPFVLDFLDIDNTDILQSGILSDSSYDDDIIAVIIHAMNRRASENGTEHYPKTNRHARVVPIYRFCSEEDYRRHFRMSKAMFEELLKTLENQTDLQQSTSVGGRPELSTEMRLYITLNYLGSRKSMRQLAKIYQVSESSVLTSVRKVVSAIYQVMQTFIKWPESSRLSNIAENFSQQTGMPRVVGVIDVSHIHVRAPVAQKDYYTNLRGKLSIILQAVCDHKMKFLHCCTGWPGSVDDASVFHDSDLYMDVMTNQSKFFPPGHYLVADSAYPLQDWLLTPFDESENLNESQVKFNQTHKDTGEVIQRAFAHLKARFPRLYYIDMVDMEDIVKVILVCCALHNYCHEKGDVELFKDTETNEEETAVHDADFNTHREEGIVRRIEITQIIASPQK